jgi:hypothetical protein
VFEHEPQVHPGLLANPDVVSFAGNTSPFEMPYGDSPNVFPAAPPQNCLLDPIGASPRFITIRKDWGKH